MKKVAFTAHHFTVYASNGPLKSCYIEDSYFFGLNTKSFTSSVLKTSEISRVRSTSEQSDVFNSRDEIYLVFTKIKVNFLFILYFL